MSSAQKIIQAAAGNAAGEALYVEDVFSTYLYEGNGSTQAITNGVDLDGEGGLVWIKNRGSGGHLLSDSARSSIGNYLVTNSTNAEANPGNFINSYNSNGFTLGTWVANTSGDDYTSWTFRKAPKFFDVVTYTGNRDAGTPTAIPHNLGSVPGCIIVKKASGTANWIVYHRNDGTTSKQGWLNLTNTFQNNGASFFTTTAPTDTNFYVGTDGDINENGQTYIAYLFAHNNGDGIFGETGDQDIIKCGSYTGTGAAGNFIDLGFEPQWVLIKRTNASGNNWFILDVMRGASASSYAFLEPNLSDNETVGGSSVVEPKATGFNLNNTGTNHNGSGSTYIYIAIRRGPMKTPESGTDVFTPVIGNNLGSAGTAFDAGFPVDLVLRRVRASVADNLALDRLRGGKLLKTNSTDAESTNASFSFDSMEGLQFSSGNNFSTEIGWNFRRAPGFFDVVAYPGSSSAKTVSHNLGVTPEMIIFKNRTDAINWIVYHKDTGSDSSVDVTELDTSDALRTSTAFFNSTQPTDSVFTVGTASHTNFNGRNYIAYLFATLPGISKVGSYTGNGTSQTIDCGFSTGARFVLIKRTDASGNWKVMDTARGIVAGDDKVLELDNTSAESTFDLIDPNSSGFAVEGNTTQGQNQSGATYIFLAIA